MIRHASPRALLATAAAALLAAGACGRAAAGARDGAAPAAAAAGQRLPAGFSESYVFLRGRVGGRPALLFFDSGASRTMLSPRLVRALGLVERGREITFGFGATAVQATAYGGTSVEIGPARFDVATVFAWPDPDLPALHGERADGIIGADLLQNRVLEIDWQSETVLSWDTSVVVPAGPGDDELRLGVVQSLPVLASRTMARGAQDSVRLVVDYGSSGSVILDGSTDVARRIAPAMREVRSRRVVGLGGAVEGPEGRIDSLVMGRQVMRAPLVFVDTAGLRTVSLAGAVGLVGTELLRRFSVVLDYPRGRAVLRPTRRLASPFCRNASGVCFERAAQNVARVTFVEPRTPAARAGLSAGDEILVIDGIPATELSDRDLDMRLDLSGTVHVAEVRRANVTMRGPGGVPARNRPAPRPQTLTLRWQP